MRLTSATTDGGTMTALQQEVFYRLGVLLILTGLIVATAQVLG